ncbi:MAG TPA: hypothetical protein PKV73_01035 [Agriterribacter sp.]|nr:hypothetical protein [Agriterribacter sp.]
MRKLFLIILLLVSLLSIGQTPMHKLIPKKAITNYDPDAQAYFTAWESATSSTMPTSAKGYFNTYVLALKSNGIWAKIGTGDIAPFYNSTAAGQAVTLLGNATLTFVGSPTHSSTGVDWDGATQYATTNWTPPNATQVSIGYYAGDASVGTSTRYEMGTNSGSSWLGIRIRSTATNSQGLGYSATITSTVANANYDGFFVYSKENNSKNFLQRNGSTLATNTGTNSTAAPTLQLYLGCLNDDGSPNLYSPNQCRFSFWFDEGLTEAEATILNTLTETLMDALGRGLQ